ncbi:MAG: SH3 domain-containing protein [Leptolyngbyaceae cyanobacterium bins.349]|nr:SH3 domain-containing protein [Leptolyngbyaceae cyanobacterium bins.349]
MKLSLFSNQNVFLVAALAIATTCMATPAQAQAIDPKDPLCRQVARPPEGLAIRRNPSTSSPQINGVGVGERVLITTNPATTRKDASGRTWVEISRPSAGWISNGFNPTNLSICSGATPPPPPPPSRCRRVINPPEGLVIRREANTTSPSVGGLALNQRMTLTTAPATTSRDAAGRTWVQIEAPAAGWVSNGLGGRSNIGVCP